MRATPLKALLLGSLGFLAVVALTIPLFGYLSYAASFLWPLVVLMVVVSWAKALTAGGRWYRTYIAAGIGILAATCIAYIGGLVALALHLRQNTEVTAPLYLGVVLLGLAAGIVVGVLVRSGRAGEI